MNSNPHDLNVWSSNCGELHLFPNVIFQTLVIEADRAQLSLLFLFVAWLALISSALWLCAVHVSKVLALEKKVFQMTYWGIMKQLVGSKWKNFAAPLLCLLACAHWEVRNLARCAKCLWSIITERVLDLACLPPHLVACCLKNILHYN